MADNLNFEYGSTEGQTNALMVAGTGSTITTTAIGTGVINGKWTAQFAAQTNTATPTVDGTTGLAFLPMIANTCCAIVFGINMAGALMMCQGPIVATSAGVTTTPGPILIAPQFPDLPNNMVPLAYTIVSVAPSGAPWTPGTSSWTASGVTATTFQNVTQLPNRPQIS